MFLVILDILEILRIPMPAWGFSGFPCLLGVAWAFPRLLEAFDGAWCLSWSMNASECFWMLWAVFPRCIIVIACVLQCLLMFLNVFKCMVNSLACCETFLTDTRFWRFVVIIIVWQEWIVLRMLPECILTTLYAPFSLFRMFKCSVILYVTKRCCISIKHILAVLAFLMIVDD